MLVDVLRAIERRLDGVLGDLIKEYAAHRLLILAATLQLLFDMPADGLGFAVGAGGNEDGVGVFGGGLPLFNHLGLAWNNLVGRLEIVLEIDADALLRQGFDVPDRSHD